MEKQAYEQSNFSDKNSSLCEKGASDSNGMRVCRDGICACYLNEWFIDACNATSISSATVFVPRLLADMNEFSRVYELYL